MRVGITGSSGFIGTNLCTYLRQRSHDILHASKEVTDRAAAIILADNSDAIVHLAGKNREKDSSVILDVNVLGTYEILRACSEANKKLIIAGSDYNRQDVYGASKRICNQMVEELSPWNVEAYCLVLPKVIGPHCKPFYNSFASTLMYCIANEIPYTSLISDPHAKLTLIHIDDVCAAIDVLLQHSYIDLTEMGYRDLPSVHLWHQGEFRVSIKQFCNMLHGQRIDHVPEKHHTQVLNTLQWYKDNAQKKGTTECIEFLRTNAVFSPNSTT